MDDASDFLEAIKADPTAAPPRLIFADWLDEQGERAKAAAQRFQCFYSFWAKEDPVVAHSRTRWRPQPWELAAELGPDVLVELHANHTVRALTREDIANPPDAAEQAIIDHSDRGRLYLVPYIVRREWAWPSKPEPAELRAALTILEGQSAGWFQRTNRYPTRDAMELNLSRGFEPDPDVLPELLTPRNLETGAWADKFPTRQPPSKHGP